MDIREKGDLLLPLLMTMMNRPSPRPSNPAPPPPPPEPQPPVCTQAEPPQPENPLELLSELAPYLPTPQKKRMYSVFAVQDFINKMRTNSYGYEALATEIDENERKQKLMEFLIKKSNNPQLTSVKTIMDQVNQLQSTVNTFQGLMGGSSGLSALLGEHMNSDACDDQEPAYEVQSEAPSLLSPEQRAHLEQLLNE